MISSDYKPLQAKEQLSSNSVLICEVCGTYSVLTSTKFQACKCNSILILNGLIQSNTKVINDCKMCSLIAYESGS